MASHDEAANQDLLGRDLTPEERALLDAYRRVKSLLDLDLPPVADANVREAASALWLAANALALTEDRPERGASL